MLEIKNISKYFNSNLVLDDLSFSVQKGKIFGLIGPNGAGKTTTLRIILNILLPSNGNIVFENQNLTQKYFNLTGYLPEERGLYPKSKVINSLVYLGQLKGLSKNEAKSSSHYWLERLNLLPHQNHNLDELSKGNQQKVQFISAIQNKPQVLILDEPFSGFDPVNQSVFTEILSEIKNDSYIILSTHLMDLAESLCEEFVLINKGKEVIKGDLNKILNSFDQNIYKIVFLKNIRLDELKKISSISILEYSENSLLVKIKSDNPAEILRDLSNKYPIVEFKKNLPSLHQLFISQVAEENN